MPTAFTRKHAHPSSSTQTDRHICGPRRAATSAAYAGVCMILGKHTATSKKPRDSLPSRQVLAAAPHPLKTPKKEQALTKHGRTPHALLNTPRSRGILTVPLKEKGTDRLVTAQGHTARKPRRQGIHQNPGQPGFHPKAEETHSFLQRENPRMAGLHGRYVTGGEG